jgi:hypothetical protein
VYAISHLLFDICGGGGTPPKKERENESLYQYINPELPLIGLNYTHDKDMPMSESVQPYTKI